MANGSVTTEAFYVLGYQTGDSVRQLTAARQAAEQLAGQTDKLATSEERLSRTSQNMLAALDPRIRAEQVASRQLEHFSRLHADGAITNERYAGTLRLVETNLKTKITALDAAGVSAGKLEAGIGSLVARYTSWAAVIFLVRRAAEEIIRTNDDAAKSYENLKGKLSSLVQVSGPLVASFFDEVSKTIERDTKDLEKLVALWERFQNLFKGGVTIPMGVSPLQPGYNTSATMNSTTRNWAASPGGFPASGVTDLTAIAEAQRKASEAQQKADEAEADRIHKLYLARAKMYDDWRIAQDKATAAFDKGVRDSLRLMGEAGIKLETTRNDALERQLQDALEYGEKAAKEASDSQAKRNDETIKDQQRVFDEAERYWRNVNESMTAIGHDFWQEWAQTGELNFKDLFGKLKSLFAGLVFDMARQWASAKIGGGVSGGGLLGFGGLSGLFGGSSTGASTGGGIGGFLGNWGGPIALGVGLVASLFKQKASDNRSVATFMPGMTDFGFGAQSAHETSQATLGGVQTAAELIRQQILAFKEVGIQFTSQLSNIWLGERDASTFQIGGGPRISAGSVGDPQDLANDVLAALLKSATSNDPAIAKMLAGGGNIAEIQQALAFGVQITDALAQITDPLKYAIDLWKKESQARLDMAAATGFSIDKVQQLNAALYQQIVQQQNAGALSSIGGLISQLEHGPMSTAAPGKQYAAALAEYQAAQKAALGGGAAEAQAYAQVTSSFLPFAREYLGTSQAYGKIETGALTTLRGLQTSLTTPAMAPDLQPLVTATQTGTNMVVGAIDSQTKVIERLETENKRLGAMIEALMKRVTEPV